MKSLKKAFVVVQPNATHLFIQDFITFEKSEAETKCATLNKEANKEWKKNHEKKQAKKKVKSPFIPTVLYSVMDLAKAIDEYGDKLQNYYSLDDESI